MLGRKSGFLVVFCLSLFRIDSFMVLAFRQLLRSRNFWIPFMMAGQICGVRGFQSLILFHFLLFNRMLVMSFVGMLTCMVVEISRFLELISRWLDIFRLCHGGNLSGLSHMFQSIRFAFGRLVWSASRPKIG